LHFWQDNKQFCGQDNKQFCGQDNKQSCISYYGIVYEIGGLKSYAEGHECDQGEIDTSRGLDGVNF